jgi:hypothetical protein
MLNKALKSILIPQYSGFVVYVHNLGNFDNIFLSRVINNLDLEDLNIEPIIRHGVTMTVKIS